MKTLGCIFIILIDIVAMAQLPPYQRNPVTTNSPSGMTNAIIGSVMPNYLLSTSDISISNAACFYHPTLPICISNLAGGLVIGSPNAATSSFRLLPYFTDVYMQNTSTGRIIFCGRNGISAAGNILLDTSTNVGIGINNPLHKLHVAGSVFSTSNMTAYGYYFPSNSMSYWPAAARTPGEGMLVNSNGYIFILTSHPSSTSWVMTNRISGQPRWDDVVVDGLQLRLGASSPQRTLIIDGIYGQGWDNTDDSDFTIQFPHGVARTNAWFPNFHFSAHIHTSAIATNAGNTAAFAIAYQYGLPNGTFGPVYMFTNWTTFPNTNTYSFIDLGHHTNNLLSGADSLVIRGNIRCLTNTTGARIIVDSADFHVPVQSYGSDSTLTDD